jgi:hypothetical protein
MAIATSEIDPAQSNLGDGGSNYWTTFGSRSGLKRNPSRRVAVAQDCSKPPAKNQHCLDCCDAHSTFEMGHSRRF